MLPFVLKLGGICIYTKYYRGFFYFYFVYQKAMVKIQCSSIKLSKTLIKFRRRRLTGSNFGENNFAGKGELRIYLLLLQAVALS